MDSAFAALDGLRVGLVTNHTAIVDTTDGGTGHLIDRLHEAPNVTLAALFGPEHGLRGTAEAGAAVADGRDAATGVPIVSLYGSTKRPP
ncbi:MAG: exo-beta-N-acetylmuramidase NamZ domain-containing protein, partial [Bacteroidota bacterium]